MEKKIIISSVNGIPTLSFQGLNIEMLVHFFWLKKCDEAHTGDEQIDKFFKAAHHYWRKIEDFNSIYEVWRRENGYKIDRESYDSLIISFPRNEELEYDPSFYIYIYEHLSNLISVITGEKSAYQNICDKYEFLCSFFSRYSDFCKRIPRGVDISQREKYLFQEQFLYAPEVLMDEPSSLRNFQCLLKLFTLYEEILSKLITIKELAQSKLL